MEYYKEPPKSIGNYFGPYITCKSNAESNCFKLLSKDSNILRPSKIPDVRVFDDPGRVPYVRRSGWAALSLATVWSKLETVQFLHEGLELIGGCRMKMSWLQLAQEQFAKLTAPSAVTDSTTGGGGVEEVFVLPNKIPKPNALVNPNPQP